MRFTASLGLCLGSLIGCATYHDDLERGQHYYEHSQYPNALAIWRTLEPDQNSLSYPEQARYAYLRGMTDYRMGFRADARHWLAVSRAIEQKHPGGLDAKSASELEQVLAELNAAVYAMGPPSSAAATGIELTNTTPVVLTPSAPAMLQVQVPVASPVVVPPINSVPAPASPAPTAPAPVSPAPTAPAPSNTGAITPSSVPPPSGF